MGWIETSGSCLKWRKIKQFTRGSPFCLTLQNLTVAVTEQWGSTEIMSWAKLMSGASGTASADYSQIAPACAKWEVHFSSVIFTAFWSNIVQDPSLNLLLHFHALTNILKTLLPYSGLSLYREPTLKGEVAQFGLRRLCRVSYTKAEPQSNLTTNANSSFW